MTNIIRLDEYSNATLSSFIRVGQKVDIKFHSNDILSKQCLTVGDLSRVKHINFLSFSR